MSKYVKELITDHIKGRFDNVNDLLLVSLAGLNFSKRNSGAASRTPRQEHQPDGGQEQPGSSGNRRDFARSGVRRLTGHDGRGLGRRDIVALAKEISKIEGDKKWAPFEAKGGVMGGAALTAVEVKQVSKWPSREEQLSILVGQILSPGSKLASQLISAGQAPWPARSSKSAKARTKQPKLRRAKLPLLKRLRRPVRHPKWPAKNLACRKTN